MIVDRCRITPPIRFLCINIQNWLQSPGSANAGTLDSKPDFWSFGRLGIRAKRL